MKIFITDGSDIDNESLCLLPEASQEFESGGWTHIRYKGQLWTVVLGRCLGHKFFYLDEPEEEFKCGQI